MWTWSVWNGSSTLPVAASRGCQGTLLEAALPWSDCGSPFCLSASLISRVTGKLIILVSPLFSAIETVVQFSVTVVTVAEKKIVVVSASHAVLSELLFLLPVNPGTQIIWFLFTYHGSVDHVKKLRVWLWFSVAAFCTFPGSQKGLIIKKKYRKRLLDYVVSDFPT